jgi:putative DNA methylase
MQSPGRVDHDAKQRADEQRSSLPLSPLDFAIEPGRKSQQLVNRRISSYLDLFSSRQLLYLARAVELLPSYEPLVRLNLSLLISTSLEFNSMLCGYKGRNMRRAGAVRHTFSHHAYSFPYTALEVNPVFPDRASGTLQKLFEGRIRRGRCWAQRPRERVLTPVRQPSVEFVELEGERDEGEEVRQPALIHQGQRRFYLHQGSAARLPLAAQTVDAVVTDPPYYDSVQYSDLSAFFRVWLRQMLPEAADWLYDESAAAIDPEQNGRDHRYTLLMTEIFGECRRVLRAESGRLIFTFHHWRPAAWAALTEALYEAGFVLFNRYVVHAEHPLSVHVANMHALTHDVILVLAPRDVSHRTMWEQVKYIDKGDSRRFCLDCGRLLGWLLQQDGLTRADFQHAWAAVLTD